MFELPINKIFASGSAGWAPTFGFTKTGTGANLTNAWWNDLRYARYGSLIHGQLAFTPAVATGSIFVTLPIKSVLSVSAFPADGSPAAITLTTGYDASGYVAISGSFPAELVYVNFIGSSKPGALTNGTFGGSRVFAINEGKYYAASLALDSGAASTLTNNGALYKHVTPRIKALYGQFTVDGAAVVKLTLPVGTGVLASAVTRIATALEYTGSVTPGVGGILFGGLPASDTYVWYALVREKGH